MKNHLTGYRNEYVGENSCLPLLKVLRWIEEFWEYGIRNKARQTICTSFGEDGQGWKHLERKRTYLLSQTTNLPRWSSKFIPQENNYKTAYRIKHHTRLSKLWNPDAQIRELEDRQYQFCSSYTLSLCYHGQFKVCRIFRFSISNYVYQFISLIVFVFAIGCSSVSRSNSIISKLHAHIRASNDHNITLQLI